MKGWIYDPRVGRFLQPDRILMESPFWSQGLNRYSYVFNSPLNLIDPSGFQAESESGEEDDGDSDILIEGERPEPPQVLARAVADGRTRHRVQVPRWRSRRQAKDGHRRERSSEALA